jgi:hypothetical protein
MSELFYLTGHTKEKEPDRQDQFQKQEKKAVPQTDFDLMACIKEGLAKFGPGVMSSVMWRMVALGDAPMEGILTKPESFMKALRSTFGRGANAVETAVVDEIRKHAGPEFSKIDNFIELVRALRSESHRPARMCIPILAR